MVTAVARTSCSKWQVESQPSRLVRLPSSHCSAPARTPSPQTIFWQVEYWPPRQTLPPPQAVPSARGLRDPQRCVESLQVEAPWQGSVGAQLRVESVERQTNLHDALQPAVPSFLPSSHSSGAVTMPSPQTGAWQAPSRQIFPPPQSAPAARAPVTEQV